MGRFPVLALLILLAAAGFWWLHSSSDGEGTAFTPGASEAAVPKGTHAPAVLQTADDAAQPGRVVAEAHAPEEAESEVPSQAAPEPLAPGGLRVRVLDAQGRPVGGVLVAWNLYVPGMGEDDRARGTTRASDGVARLDLAEGQKNRDRMEAMGFQFRHRVVAEVASADPVRVELEGWPQEGQEVDLILPPTGSLRVRILPAEGAILPEDPGLNLRWSPAEVVGREENVRYERVDQEPKTLEPGLLQYDRLSLGLAFSVTAFGKGFMPGTVEPIAGPTEAGQVVETSVQLGQALAYVRMQVLDAGGAPLVSTRLGCEVRYNPDGPYSPHSSGNGYRLGNYETDAQGVLQVSFGPGEEKRPRRLLVDRLAVANQAQEDPDWSRGAVDLPNVLHPGEVIELPIVRLHPANLLAAGQVVSSEGVPIEGARLRFQERYGDTHQYSWSNIGFLNSDRDGRFHLRGLDFPPYFQVEVTAKGYAGKTFPLASEGNPNLVLELAPAGEAEALGSARVHVLMDNPMDSMRCLLRFESKGKSRSPDWWAGSEITITHLRPGTYTVRVETRDGDFELGRVEGVEIRANETTAEARLLPLDLRGTLQTAQLRLLTESGEPHRRRTVSLQVPGQGRILNARSDDTGLAVVLLPASASAIDLSPERGQVLRVQLRTDGEATEVRWKD
ncbi:MAG: carboxypeptidase-like regulatory domain-containing protein [Planctomycetota bacterium]